jgi:4-hydroxy-3-methylbut-2-en-1-yl diphosphate reductase
MKIYRAYALGFCFGVRQAIALAERTAARSELTVWGELVHNPSVLESLRQQGVKLETDLSRLETDAVMITAHGISMQAKQRLQGLGHKLLDGTCPLVYRVHRAVAELVAQGYFPVIVGQRSHSEVRGVTEDYPEHAVVLTPEEVAKLGPRARFGVVAQTTQPIDLVHRLVELLQHQYPESEVRFVDTVCDPTKRRQQAAVELASQVEVMVVIGGSHSNNTRQLAETCRQHCARIYQVENASQLDAAWFAGMETVGVTAGTSTPDSVIAEVMACLERWNDGASTDEMGCARWRPAEHRADSLRAEVL